MGFTVIFLVVEGGHVRETVFESVIVCAGVSRDLKIGIILITDISPVLINFKSRGRRYKIQPLKVLGE